MFLGSTKVLLLVKSISDDSLTVLLSLTLVKSIIEHNLFDSHHNYCYNQCLILIMFSKWVGILLELVPPPFLLGLFQFIAFNDYNHCSQIVECMFFVK